ncbi:MULTISPECIES: DUF5597 domain-containing protein [Acidobacteriaceae]|uniref:GH35 family beta-galactosidase n=1 Tax=Acidobacteriaceae TaxID=204434 RepID=UPI00131D643E|nr:MULTISPECIES: DUF5597 domain-containing protein [Acidobacteriaceae]MDW5265469.1 DUF5597 domain-containing protein [Edaphobacter sp.]
MKHRICIPLLIASWLFTPLASPARELPTIQRSQDQGQLLVNGKPYLILGGELGNSSSGTAEQADTVLPRLAKLHVNTALTPVTWGQIEPTEGKFDFDVLDHWIDVARQQHLHLVLLWFGSWKNAFSNDAPIWVRQDTKRFPRAISADGTELEILSTLGPETLKLDRTAFSALMNHVREKDVEQQTVLMVQVENEVGYLGLGGRDRSSAANQLFRSAVPSTLLQKLEDDEKLLPPKLSENFHPEGKSWQQVFGDNTDEVFMAWNYARFIQSVAAAGKQAYPLPMYVNAQLPAPAERAGEYPSGGPHPDNLDIYRATAQALDFYSPDIYWPNFAYWMQRYHFPGNAAFVPEARIESAPFNAFYAYGESKAFGFSAFGIDSVEPSMDGSESAPGIQQTYKALEDLSDILVPAQASGHTRGLVLHADSPRPTQTVSLGGFLFDATLSRSWPAKSLLTNDGAMIIVQTARDEFFIAGRGLAVSIARDPDVDNLVAGIGSIDEVSRIDGKWVTQRRLIGDQSNQGRQLSMSANQVRIYRVVLYTAEQAQQAQ